MLRRLDSQRQPKQSLGLRSKEVCHRRSVQVPIAAKGRFRSVETPD